MVILTLNLTQVSSEPKSRLGPINRVLTVHTSLGMYATFTRTVPQSHSGCARHKSCEWVGLDIYLLGCYVGWVRLGLGC